MKFLNPFIQKSSKEVNRQSKPRRTNPRETSAAASLAVPLWLAYKTWTNRNKHWKRSDAQMVTSVLTYPDCVGNFRHSYAIRNTSNSWSAVDWDITRDEVVNVRSSPQNSRPGFWNAVRWNRIVLQRFYCASLRLIVFITATEKEKKGNAKTIKWTEMINLCLNGISHLTLKIKTGNLAASVETKWWWIKEAYRNIHLQLTFGDEKPE